MRTKMPEAKTTSQAPANLDECSCAGRNLDRFLQPAILAVLADEPLHGYSVLEHLKGMRMFGEHAPDSTGVYRFLNAMEGRGLLTSTWDTSGSGPAKKTFRITDAGRDCLRRWAETLSDYHAQLGHLLDVLRNASAAKTPPKSDCSCGKAGHRTSPTK